MSIDHADFVCWWGCHTDRSGEKPVRRVWWSRVCRRNDLEGLGRAKEELEQLVRRAGVRVDQVEWWLKPWDFEHSVQVWPVVEPVLDGAKSE